MTGKRYLLPDLVFVSLLYLACCHLCHRTSWVQEFQDGLAANLEACAAVRESQILRVVLHISLKVGNLLHLGTSRQGAKGIKLESMLKMRDLRVTKSAAGGGTKNLLDFVVREVIKVRKGQKEPLKTSLQAVNRACSYAQSDLLALMNQVCLSRSLSLLLIPLTLSFFLPLPLCVPSLFLASSWWGRS